MRTPLQLALFESFVQCLQSFGSYFVSVRSSLAYPSGKLQNSLTQNFPSILMTRIPIGYKEGQRKDAHCASHYSCVVRPLSYRQRSRHFVESFSFLLRGALAFTYIPSYVHALRRQLAWLATYPTMTKGLLSIPMTLDCCLESITCSIHLVAGAGGRLYGLPLGSRFHQKSKRPSTSRVARGLLPTIPSTGLRFLTSRATLAYLY